MDKVNTLFVESFNYWSNQVVLRGKPRAKSQKSCSKQI